MSRVNKMKWMLLMFVGAALAVPGVVAAEERPAHTVTQPAVSCPVSEPALRVESVPTVEQLFSTPPSACPTSCNTNAQCTTGCGDAAACVKTGGIGHCILL